MANTALLGEKKADRNRERLLWEDGLDRLEVGWLQGTGEHARGL